MNAWDQSAPIGIFDSGVGGLSVVRAIKRRLPNESLIYLADQAHVPYGLRSLAEVRSYAEGITRYMLASGAKMIVVACNTASAAALHQLRRLFAQVPFIGMEPAVKPAAENTDSGVVGVLATPATFQGALYASLVERFANGVSVLQDTCPGLVEKIEAGELDSPATRAILNDALGPMLEKGIDTVVLGCTHYPFVIPLIQDIVGDGVRVIDPSPAVARQVERVLADRGINNLNPFPGEINYLTTAEPGRLTALTAMLLGEEPKVTSVAWGSAGLQADAPKIA